MVNVYRHSVSALTDSREVTAHRDCVPPRRLGSTSRAVQIRLTPEQNVQIWDSAIEVQESVHVEKDSRELHAQEWSVQEVKRHAAVTEDA